MKEIQDHEPQSPTTPPKKKSPLYKFTMFANLMTIPALAFFYYVGLDGKMNGYFILLVLMIVTEVLIMRKNFKE